MTTDLPRRKKSGRSSNRGFRDAQPAAKLFTGLKHTHIYWCIITTTIITITITIITMQ